MSANEHPNDDYPSDDEEYCSRCDGNGFYHDCGEDTCCCADPEVDDLVVCPDCQGTGR